MFFVGVVFRWELFVGVFYEDNLASSWNEDLLSVSGYSVFGVDAEPVKLPGTDGRTLVSSVGDTDGPGEELEATLFGLFLSSGFDEAFAVEDDEVEDFVLVVTELEGSLHRHSWQTRVRVSVQRMDDSRPRAKVQRRKNPYQNGLMREEGDVEFCE